MAQVMVVSPGDIGADTTLCSLTKRSTAHPTQVMAKYDGPTREKPDGAVVATDRPRPIAPTRACHRGSIDPADRQPTIKTLFSASRDERTANATRNQPR